MGTTERKKEVIDICLKTFIQKGLSDTSTRDLSKAIKSSSSGLYYYFEDKDDAVIACAEEAAIRLEINLLLPTFNEISDPDRMMSRLRSRAQEMTPIMKFFASVCALSKYKERMQPVLARLSERYEHYAEEYAEKLQCSKDEIAPFVYMAISAVANFMIFDESNHTDAQMRLIKNKLKDLIDKNR